MGQHKIYVPKKPCLLNKTVSVYKELEHKFP